MNRTETEITLEVPDWTIAGRSDEEIRQQVSLIVEATELQTVQDDRRLDKRVAFPYLLTITPIAELEPVVLIGEPVDVVGRCLAERGLTFFHTQNLPFRRAVVSFDPPNRPAAHLVLNISWSRFLRPGWYDSGGRFTHVLREHNENVSRELFGE